MVICLERGADLSMAQLMPLPLAVSCFSKIQIGFTFLVLAHLGSPGKGPLNGCVCVCVIARRAKGQRKLVTRVRTEPPKGHANHEIDISCARDRKFFCMSLQGQPSVL